MKGRIANLVIIVILFLVAGVPSYFWIKTDDTLSDTRLALETSKTTLAATNATLTATEKTLTETKTTLAATNATLTATETNLNATEKKLAATDVKLNVVKQELATVENEKTELWARVYSTQAQMKSIEKSRTEIAAKLASIETKLASVEPTLFLPSPEYKATWDYSRVYPFMRDTFPGAKVFVRTSVKLVTRRDWVTFLITDKTNQTPYSLVDFNCTEYSLILEGKARTWAPAAAFGIVDVFRPGIDQPNYWHRMNLLIDENGKVWLVEPQNDSVFLPPTDWQYLLIVI